jgi:hypothetical protein
MTKLGIERIHGIGFRAFVGVLEVSSKQNV